MKEGPMNRHKAMAMGKKLSKTANPGVKMKSGGVCKVPAKTKKK